MPTLLGGDGESELHIDFPFFNYKEMGIIPSIKEVILSIPFPKATDIHPNREREMYQCKNAGSYACST